MSIVQPKISTATATAARSDLGAAPRVLGQLRSLMRVLQRAGECVLTWQQRARERRALESLSDHMLRDIGLTRADVLAESTKRFWER